MLEYSIENDRLVRALLLAPGALQRHMNRNIGRAIHEIARAWRSKAPKAESTYTNSIRPEMVSAFEGVAVAGVDYARAVEEGTGLYGPRGAASGKAPPVNAIHDWIRVKNITPDDPYMDQQDLAFVIARSIAARGTPAQPSAGPALEEKRARAEQLVEQAIDAALAEVGRA